MPMPPKARQQLRRRRPGASRTVRRASRQILWWTTTTAEAETGCRLPHVLAAGFPALLFALTVPQARRDPAHAIASTVPRSRKSQRLLICRCGCGGCHWKRSCVRSQIPINGLRWTSRPPSTPRWITIATPGSACRGRKRTLSFTQSSRARLPMPSCQSQVVETREQHDLLDRRQQVPVQGEQDQFLGGVEAAASEIDPELISRIPFRHARRERVRVSVVAPIPKTVELPTRRRAGPKSAHSVPANCWRQSTGIWDFAPLASKACCRDMRP